MLAARVFHKFSRKNRSYSILKAARAAMNEKSIYYRVKYVCSNPSTQTIVKGSEICVYIYRYHDSLSEYKSDKDMYHCVHKV